MVPAKNQRMIPVGEPAPGSRRPRLPVTWLLSALVIVLAGCGAEPIVAESLDRFATAFAPLIQTPFIRAMGWPNPRFS